MIAGILRSGFRLSRRRDPRLARGLAWTALEGLLAAAPYPLVYLLLQAAYAGTATPALIFSTMAGIAIVIGLRIAAARRGMPLVFSGAYAMMGEARLRIADHMRCLPMGWFAHQRAGDVSARLTSDLELVEHLWSHFLGTFVSGLVTPGCLLLFLFWLDWRLALAVFTGVPMSLLALGWALRVVSRPGARLIAASAAAQSLLLEYVQGIAVIRAFGRYGQAWARLSSVLDEQHAALLAVEARPAPWLALFGFLLETGYVGLLFAGVWCFEAGTLSPDILVAFLVLALPIYRQLYELGLSAMMLRFGQRALARIEALLAAPALPEPCRPQAPGHFGIEFLDVCFSYGDGRPALDGVSCCIPAHRLTAVVGGSGAGKSTLVHLIGRLWDVESGSIRLGGVDLRDMGSSQVQRHVGMVFQDVLLFAGTVLDNLCIGRPDASLAEIVVAAKRARAHDFICALPQGYDTLLDEGGASLSGGERQRLSIARALLKDAPVLLLDEATASVDASAEAVIQEAIAELARGRTVIVIAHQLKNVCDADQILVLDRGRLVEQGTHDELLRQQGRYAQLWNCQQTAQSWRLSPGDA